MELKFLKFNNMIDKEPVIYDQSYIDSLRERNAIRLKEARERLGNKWLMHPDNKIGKLNKDNKTKDNSYDELMRK